MTSEKLSQEKQEYKSPQLIVYGDIRSLTKGSGTGHPDAKSAPGKT